MKDPVNLTLRKPPAAGLVELRFGEVQGLSLSFFLPPVASPGPVALVFGDEGSAPSEGGDATLTLPGAITGLLVAGVLAFRWLPAPAH